MKKKENLISHKRRLKHHSRQQKLVSESLCSWKHSTLNWLIKLHLQS